MRIQNVVVAATLPLAVILMAAKLPVQLPSNAELLTAKKFICYSETYTEPDRHTSRIVARPSVELANDGLWIGAPLSIREDTDKDRRTSASECVTWIREARKAQYTLMRGERRQ